MRVRERASMLEVTTCSVNVHASCLFSIRPAVSCGWWGGDLVVWQGHLLQTHNMPYGVITMCMYGEGKGETELNLGQLDNSWSHGHGELYVFALRPYVRLSAMFEFLGSAPSLISVHYFPIQQHSAQYTHTHSSNINEFSNLFCPEIADHKTVGTITELARKFFFIAKH